MNESYDDPLDEVYAIRRRISAKYGNDIHLIFAAAREEQRKAEARGVRYVRLPIARREPAVVQ